MNAESLDQRVGTPAVADHSLLLQRVEQLLAADPDSPQAARLLSDEAAWKRLQPGEALRWARLAEAAGLLELSLQVLAHLNAVEPAFTEAWQARTELLEALGRGREAQTGTHRAPGGGVPWEESPVPGAPAAVPAEELLSPDERDDPAAPFFALRRREEQVARYMDLFQGREDCFARQWADRREGTQGYVPVRRPMEAADVLEHLQGHKTYGIYLLKRDSRVRVAVIDADLAPSCRTPPKTAQENEKRRREKSYLLQRMIEIGRERDLPCLAEFSGGKGFHFWYFFSEPVPAPLARSVLQGVCQVLAPDLSCFNLEVFPKQDQLAGKGLGNLVKLPLGVHRATGRPSFLVGVHDRRVEAQLEALKKVRKIPLETLEAAAPAGKGRVIVHPRHQAWAEEFPELAVLGERCTALGHIMAGCRQSRTLSVREEKILFSTIGFLPRARALLHHLLREIPEYNPHLVDYRLSRVRGTPLGCKRIHSLLEMSADLCPFPESAGYPHPLLHWPQWSAGGSSPRGERAVNLQEALENLRHAIETVERFLPPERLEP